MKNVQDKTKRFLCAKFFKGLSWTLQGFSINIEKKQQGDSKKERSFYVKLLKKAKREFYDNVNVKSITYNK